MVVVRQSGSLAVWQVDAIHITRGGLCSTAKSMCGHAGPTMSDARMWLTGILAREALRKEVALLSRDDAVRWMG